MAEVLGVVASGISVASLAIQVADSLSKVINFCESIREAPADIQRLILELHLLLNIISVIQTMVTNDLIPAKIEPVLLRALTLVRHDVASLSILSSELDRKLRSERKIIRSWARVQTVFSEKKIILLKSHLESAKGGLNLLQGCIIIEKVSSLDSIAREVPKALGYQWETGEQERHVKIDDGLDKPFFVPLDLCSSPKDLVSLLELKYKSRKLPGLTQIRRGHLAVFDWTRNTKVDFENWEKAVKSGGQIRVAFLMSSWHGLSRTKCIRCFKPYSCETAGYGFRICSSCGLEVLMVEPQAITFETADIEIGLRPDEYRYYRLSKRNKQPVKKAPPRPPNKSTAHATSRLSSTRSYDNPPIDLVCKRLVVKWEPIFNFVHRYLYCRCVIRKTTSSRVEKEQTILVWADCPRHNMNGTSHEDYGDLEYDKDPYFDLFGGYLAFRGFVYLFAPNIYQILGEEKFIPAVDLDEAIHTINKRIERDFEGLKNAFFEYYFDVNDAVDRAGIVLPEREARFIEVERQKRREESLASCKEHGIELDGRGWELSEEQQRKLSESRMMKEVGEILDGKWNGKSHREVNGNMEHANWDFGWAGEGNGAKDSVEHT